MIPTPKIKKPFNGEYRISFRYGEKPDWYINRFGYPHNGIDYATPVGVVIRACDKGIIQYADSVPDGNGMGINMGHEWGMSQYWHLDRLTVKQGTSVETGQPIGISGATGFVTGPHLHFAVKVKGIEPAGMRGWSDPLNYIENQTPDNNPIIIKPKYVIVRPGDSLYKIAVREYGDGTQWKRIYDANRDKIKEPALIYPIQKLLIP